MSITITSVALVLAAQALEVDRERRWGTSPSGEGPLALSASRTRSPGARADPIRAGRDDSGMDARGRFAELMGFAVPPAQLEVLGERRLPGYVERRVRFGGREGDVPAFLLVPDGRGPFPGVVAFHQHNSEWHLGKSEVAGRAGDPRQAFGPALARAGVAVLAPDAVGFEDRRRSGPGTEPREEDGRQHFNEMAYRVVRGDLLTTTVLRDAAAAVSALAAEEVVDGARVGALGHSYGGNVALMLAALDERVRFACASGAACTFRHRMAAGTGLELAHIVPGILELGDLDDLVALIAPRPLLVVSATEDPYSADADAVVGGAAPAWSAHGAVEALEHARYEGGHPMTRERFERIVEWVLYTSSAS
jgi:dienelactone hydrolase